MAEKLTPKFIVNRPGEDEGTLSEIGEGIVIIFAHKNGKVGLGVGITKKFIDMYDAVKLAKIGSEIIGGKGGGGRPDFAQAGGVDETKIEDAFDKLKSLI